MLSNNDIREIKKNTFDKIDMLKKLIHAIKYLSDSGETWQ